MDPVVTLILVGGMVLAATVLLRFMGAGVRLSPLVAIARAALQLGVLVFVLRLVFSSMWLVFGWLLVMVVVAVITSTRRIGWSRRHLVAAACAITAGAAVTVGIIVASGAVGLEPQYVLATGGIVIGNTMSVTSVTAKRLREYLTESRDEIEGMLALGATPWQAARRFRGLSIGHALIPTIDSTSTTGLVTLPGAFVGALFGGADPLHAGLFQLTVLGGIMLAGSIAGSVVAAMLGAPKTLPSPPRDAGKKLE